MSETPPMTPQRRMQSYGITAGTSYPLRDHLTPAQRRRAAHKDRHARRGRTAARRAAPEPQQEPQAPQQPAAPDETRPQPMTAQAIQAAAAAPRHARIRGLPTPVFRLRRKQAR